MGTARRAIRALMRRFERGETDQGVVNGILRINGLIDVSCFERFLVGGCSAWVRADAARVIVAKGDPNVVIEAARHEKNIAVVSKMLEALGKCGKGELSDLAFLLNQDESVVVKDAAIKMFKDAGREDCLMPLLLSMSRDEVQIAKRCMNEQNRRNRAHSDP